ncbi:MAG: hypothetical protein U9P14_02870, partial [Gemmatimonadota bacterium]|nr:hypothetical protein [Gemmatimonadota bacterium]
MSNSLIESVLARTDTLLEKLFHRQDKKKSISFRTYLTGPGKILLIPGKSLSDLVFSFDFITATAERFPGAEVYVLVDARYACLMDNIPRVRCIEFENRKLHLYDGSLRKITLVLQHEEFDWAVNLSSGTSRSEGLITSSSGAKIHTGLPIPNAERYYNLIINPPRGNYGFRESLNHLFRALQIEKMPGSRQAGVLFTEQELKRGAGYVSMRKGRRKKHALAAFAPAWQEDEKALVRNLHEFYVQLSGSLDSSRMLVTANLAPDDQIADWENSAGLTHRFASLRNAIVAMACCNRVITNSVGLACLLVPFEVPVGLIPTDETEVARLNEDELKRIQV